MTVRSDRPQGLGRGLAALIPQRAPTASGSIEIPLSRIRENPRQPRLRMDDNALAGLAESIRQHGVIQPILVTETIDGYTLVAGERRVRAARIAGLERPIRDGKVRRAAATGHDYLPRRVHRDLVRAVDLVAISAQIRCGQELAHR